MRVLMVAAEAAPLAKVGGLADVLGALPEALREEGVDVRVALPAYRGTVATAEAEVCAQFMAPVAGTLKSCTVYEGRFPGSPVPVYLLGHDPYFDRPAVYGEDGDYPDALERFAFLSRAALELPEAVGFQPDVYHAHDWHAALVPVYLQSGIGPAAPSLFTIHNLVHQGWFPVDQVGVLGLEEAQLAPLLRHGQLNLMQGAIRTADALNTVSPTYTREILEHGAGLEEELRARRADLVGVLNGVDYRVWDPATDPHLWARYDADSLEGKEENKMRLQQALGLRVGPDVPLVGMVARLVEQKGLDLIVEALDRMVALGIQLVVLGTGQAAYEEAVRDAARRHPGRMAAVIDFSEEMAHRIEAGSDMFLMPSRFEPGGLNQLYSLRYGTVPIVRATGGLVDTVRAVEEDPEGGTGFVFREYTPEALLGVLRRAVDLYRRQPARWRALMVRGMREDFSWRASARTYLTLYRRLREGS